MIGSEDEARQFCAERCDDAATNRLGQFVEMLVAENQQQNLVSRASLDQVWQRHIADSVQLLDHVPRETGDWLDLGSGAGLPGLVLAIARPNMRIALVESRKRRIDWLEHVIGRFALRNCNVIGMRLEKVESRPIGVITARAFAPLDKLLDLSARFSTHSTTWLLPKGRSGAQELSRQPAAIQEMFHVEQSKTNAEAEILVGKGRPPNS